MKKLFIVSLLLSSFLMMGQVKTSTSYTTDSLTHPFGRGIAAGTRITNLQTGFVYTMDSAATSSQSLATSPGARRIDEPGSGSADLGNYSYSGSDWIHLITRIFYVESGVSIFDTEVAFNERVKMETLDDNGYIPDEFVMRSSVDKYLKKRTLNDSSFRINDDEKMTVRNESSIWNSNRIRGKAVPSTFEDGDMLVFNSATDSFSVTKSGGFYKDSIITRLPAIGEPWDPSMYYQTLPTISINISPTTTFYEAGTSNSITISGITNNPSNATLSNGELKETTGTDVVVDAFGSASSYSYTFTFSPTGDETETYRAWQDYSFSNESGTISTSSKSINSNYPVYHGTSKTIYFEGASVDASNFTKLLQDEGDHIVTFNGTAVRGYYLFPYTWSDTALSTIVQVATNYDTRADWISYNVKLTSGTQYVNIDYRVFMFKEETSYTNADYKFNRE